MEKRRFAIQELTEHNQTFYIPKIERTGFFFWFDKRFWERDWTGFINVWKPLEDNWKYRVYRSMAVEAIHEYCKENNIIPEIVEYS